MNDYSELGPEQVRMWLTRLDQADNPAKARRGRIRLMYNVLAAIAERSVEDPVRIAAAVVSGIDRGVLLQRDASGRVHNERASKGERPVLPAADAGAETPRRAMRRRERRKAHNDPHRMMQRHIQQMVRVLPKQRLICVSTPKVASTTIRATLWRLGLDDPEAVPPHQVHDTRFSPLSRPPDLGLEEFVQWANSREYKRFCFVRNPYTRVLSCYLNKIKGNEGDNRPGISNFRAMVSRAGTSDGVTFEEFLDTVGQQTPMKMNPHWRVQTAHLLWGRIAYDFVGRIEDFDADLDRLGALLEIDLKRYLDVRNKHQTGAKTALNEYYTPRLQERVYSIYESDFKAFGYSPELPAFEGQRLSPLGWSGE